jgi:hypothetical protein
MQVVPVLYQRPAQGGAGLWVRGDHVPRRIPPMSKSFCGSVGELFEKKLPHKIPQILVSTLTVYAFIPFFSRKRSP